MPARHSIIRRASVRSSATLLAVLLGATAGPLLSPEPAAAGVVRVGGIGGSSAVIGHLAVAFRQRRPGDEVIFVPGLGSSGGVKAVLAGAIDFAVTGRTLWDGERAAGAKEVAFARTPLVFAAAEDTSFTDLRMSEVPDIYAGRITTWPDGSPLRLILRPAKESDSLLLRQISPEIGAALDAALRRPGMILAPTDPDNLDALERVPGSLGVSTLGQIAAERRRVRPLAVDGVTPSGQALASGAYPLSKTLYAVSASRQDEAGQAFCDFLHSSEAARVLLALEYIPVEGGR